MAESSLILTSADQCSWPGGGHCVVTRLHSALPVIRRQQSLAGIFAVSIIVCCQKCSEGALWEFDGPFTSVKMVVTKINVNPFRFGSNFHSKFIFIFDEDRAKKFLVPGPLRVI